MVNLIRQNLIIGHFSKKIHKIPPPKKIIWSLLPECPCGYAAVSLIEIAVVSTFVTEKTISPQLLRFILLHPLH